MTHQESNLLFDEVDLLLSQNGFERKEGYDKRYRFKNNLMAFNCPHICSSLRLFQLPKEIAGSRKLVVDVRTSFVKSLEENRELVSQFINRVIEKTNGTDQTISGTAQVAV